MVPELESVVEYYWKSFRVWRQLNIVNGIHLQYRAVSLGWNPVELKKRGLLVRMSGPPTPHVVVDCTGNWRTTCRVDKTPTLERRYGVG